VSDTVVEALILDLLEWLATGERRYQEVMDAWRTSCPKLPVWENANDRRLVMEGEANGRRIAGITALGVALVDQHKMIQRERHNERRSGGPISS
jgi:hypothetical protein